MKLDKVISGGSYSQVYLSWIRDTPYAVKVVKVERQDKPITWDYWGQIVVTVFNLLLLLSEL